MVTDEELLQLAEKDLLLAGDAISAETSSYYALRSLAASQLVVARNSVPYQVDSGSPLDTTAMAKVSALE